MQTNGSKYGETTTYHRSGDLGAVQGDAMREITGQLHSRLAASLNNASIPKVAGTAFIEEIMDPEVTTTGIQTQLNASGWSRITMRASYGAPVANEIRPVNIAVKYIIKVR